MPLFVELISANLNYSLHNEVLHLYTVFGASFLDFSLFSLIYWRILIDLHNDRKWRSSLAVCLLYCSAVALSALISLVEGWKVSWIRGILPKVCRKESPR